MVQAPVLSTYNPVSETELHCDGSKLRFGCAASKTDRFKFPSTFFYFSKRTIEAESKYHSFELETLAIIYSLRRFKMYPQGIKFKIVTDCNSFKLCSDKRDINSRISLWALELEHYDKVIEHIGGDRMKHTDASSRIYSIMVFEENSFEANLIASQNRDKNICEVREILQTSQDPLFDIKKGLIYRKYNNEILFYGPEKMEYPAL